MEQTLLCGLVPYLEATVHSRVFIDDVRCLTCALATCLGVTHCRRIFNRVPQDKRPCPPPLQGDRMFPEPSHHETAGTPPGLCIGKPSHVYLADLRYQSTCTWISVAHSPSAETTVHAHSHTCPCPEQVPFSQRKPCNSFKMHRASASLSHYENHAAVTWHVPQVLN